MAAVSLERREARRAAFNVTARDREDLEWYIALTLGLGA